MHGGNKDAFAAIYQSSRLKELRQAWGAIPDESDFERGHAQQKDTAWRPLIGDVSAWRKGER